MPKSCFDRDGVSGMGKWPEHAGKPLSQLTPRGRECSHPVCVRASVWLRVPVLQRTVTLH